MLIVQKYGGTSVGSVERIEAVADRVAKTVAAGHRCAVVVSAMGDTTDDLLSLALAVTERPDARELDALLATGEQVSAALLAMALQKRGLAARSFSGWQAGIQTEAIHGSARMTEIQPEPLRTALNQGIVPVITGFQGIAGTDVTTLGRGGSDTTAVAVAAVLQADLCEIYTDVDGVYTSDPRVVPGAKKLSQISYDEMLELAHLGAQVLHPRAVENAKKYGVQLVVRSSFSEEEGTQVVETVQGLETQQLVTGVAFERQVARVAVIGVPLNRHGIATVFSTLADANINVDVIVQSVVSAEKVDVSFTVKEGDAELAVEFVQGLQSTLGFQDVVCETGLAKVSIVGAGMISNPGVAATMFQTLASEDIPLKMVSTSEIKVSCIIPGDKLDLAANRLHEVFLEEAHASVGVSERPV
ncbi:MAG: aspartate kinase [Alicyclobacillus herbarius]|uniref:aspartate kinase n=1 Tax=Alicyclobacillus herbarius TaxID=122960 RepID=UPI002352F6E9|nr:aspartate kinase [Alicyclobacillus herbarius]MCL6632691.1 aspartate kinase [Alicyclobacillus herbarius]